MLDISGAKKQLRLKNTSTLRFTPGLVHVYPSSEDLDGYTCPLLQNPVSIQFNFLIYRLCRFTEGYFCCLITDKYVPITYYLYNFSSTERWEANSGVYHSGCSA